MLIGHTNGSDAAANRWALPCGMVDGQPFDMLTNDSSQLALLDDELQIEMPWLSYIGDFDEAGCLCRVFGCSLPDSTRSARAAWFTDEQIDDIASGDGLVGGYEAVAIRRRLDRSYLRGMDRNDVLRLVSVQGMHSRAMPNQPKCPHFELPSSPILKTI